MKKLSKLNLKSQLDKLDKITNDEADELKGGVKV